MNKSVLIAVLTLLAAATQTLAQNACTIPAPKRIPGIRYFAQVTPDLYRGAVPQDARAFKELAARGVKIDVELETGRDQAAREARWAKAAGIRYIHLPWFPWLFFSRPHKKVVEAFLSILANNSGKPVFVHCRQGSDRTGVVVAAYQIEVAHCSKKLAIKEMHRFGYHWYLFPLWGKWVKHVAVRYSARKASDSG